jgi:hypothetical protein
MTRCGCNGHLNARNMCNICIMMGCLKLSDKDLKSFLDDKVGAKTPPTSNENNIYVFSNGINNYVSHNSFNLNVQQSRVSVSNNPCGLGLNR